MPKDFDEKQLGLNIKRTVEEWSHLGVKNKYNSSLPNSKIIGSVIAPDGVDGPAFLVYDNFRVFLRWNKSLPFATSVGLISEGVIN